jgi:molecular chaperone GrpE
MSKRFTNGESGEPSVETGAEETTAAEATSGSSTASEELAAALAEKTREVAELNDKYLRTLAESENIRKRVRQQSEESVRYQRENLIRDLLPIVDNLERAVQAAQGAADSRVIVDGVEMVLRSLLDLLKTHGVVPLNVVGHPFDPSRHEAVDQVESAEHPPNTVVSEFHRGYLIGDRMLRTARVAVTKGGTGNASDDGSGGTKPSES